jgi:hypothetical protein
MYDYIIFYFSGGSDSITALNSFVKNNILIDEIVIYINSDTPHPKVSGQYAVDYLKKINYQGYVNIIDLNFDVMNKIINEETWRQYECFSGFLHSFQRFQVSFFEENNYVTGKKRIGNIANVFSTTFPLISLMDEIYISKISIIPFTMIAAAYYKNVLFFTDENMPEVFIKQSYIVGRYMKNNNLISSNEYKEFKSLVRDEYNEEISPIKNSGDLVLRSKKHKNDILSSKDILTSKDILSSQNGILCFLYRDKIDFLNKCTDIRKKMNNFDYNLISNFSRNYELNLD